MVGYVTLREQVDADFGRARQRAVLRRVAARLRSDPASDRLLCFEEVRKKSGALNRVRLGRRVVPAQRIAESVGRCSDFDGAFLPAKASVKARWKQIDRAFCRDEELPPVSLYKIGGTYFVVDGNHRVSVARYHGIEWIHAQVTEFRVPSPVQPAGASPFAKPKGHTRPDESPERGDSKMNVTTDHQERIEVRRGLHEDEAQHAERVVQEADNEWTVVRCAWFSQNFSESHLLEPILSGEFALPAGDVPAPFVDAEDIADVAVVALTEDGHAGELYELTGPWLLTFEEAVGEIAEATGREIRSVPIFVEEYAAALTEQDVPDESVSLLTYLFGEVLDGRNAHLTDGVRRALGQESRYFAEYARDGAATGVWEGGR